MKKKPNPEIDFGFYAGIPRLVRTGYKATPDGQKITPTQKWFYTCLKDLCGDTGTCYRTVRSLAEETDLSTGLVSESIPVLHASGLIHATKKKRSTGGKEVWHITIVDIWPANGKAHPTKKVHVQDMNNTEKNVHCVNENVQIVNKPTEECSLCERECSQIRYRRKNNKARTIEERTEKQERENTPVVFNSPPHASDDALSLSFLHPELTFESTVEAAPPTEETAASSKAIDTESHSYSHANQISTPQPAQEPMPEEKPALVIVPQSTPEKPKRGKSEKQLAHEKRMAEIFTLFDELFAEHLDDPEYKVPRTNAKNKEKVRDLITQNATDQGIKNTWYSIKHDPDKFWQQEGRLTISCVSSQYASRCKKTLASAKPTSIMAKSNAFHERVEAARKVARGEVPFEEISMQILPLIPREEAIQYNATLRGIRRAAQLAKQKAGAYV